VSLRTLQEQTIIGSPLAQIPMSASSLIVLQKSQKALRRILCRGTNQARIADQCSRKAVPRIAGEFAAWRRRSPPHYYSIVAPTARRIWVPCGEKTFATLCR